MDFGGFFWWIFFLFFSQLENFKGDVDVPPFVKMHKSFCAYFC